jgi:hypothetical protein
VTAAGLTIGGLLALALLGRELVGITGASLRAQDRRALDVGTWALAAAFAVLTLVRVLQFLA